MTRVIQIADTHISPGKNHFLPNWPPLVSWIAQQRPALVVHGGDVTVDGAGQEEDIRFCAERMAELPGRWRAVPGNHDVGEADNPYQPVNSERIARWRRHLGPDWWAEDLRAVAVDRA